jgi:predicted small lipoprotein YifL
LLFFECVEGGKDNEKSKKILPFVIIMILSVTLIACGGKNAESQVGSNESKAAENL